MKMRKIVVGDAVGYITEEELAGERIRWNIDGFTMENHIYKSTVPCPTCISRNGNCVICEARVYGKDYCMAVVLSVVPDFKEVIMMTREAMIFKESDYERAVIMLNKMLDFFNNSPEVDIGD
jgi:hypothetical protein